MKMKKLKKLVAGILSAAMVMSTMAVTAFAAGETSTIDTDTDVSLTIHKYRMEDVGDATFEGTGNAGDESQVPNSAEGLNGVTFNVYRVADIEQAVNETGATELRYKTVNSIASSVGDYISSESDVNAIKTAVENAKLQPATGETQTYNGKDGIVVFNNATLENLDTADQKTAQGLYLVVETDAPDVVTQKANPFLVSLPMTTEVNGTTQWLYDVHVFPKNGTMTSAITLKKQGKVGNGTETDVANSQFVLQKYDSDSEAWNQITVDDNGDPIGTNGVITVPATGITIDGLSQGRYRFIETKAPDEEYIMDGATTYEFIIDDNGTVTGDSVTGSTIKVTNYKPTVEKTVKDKDSENYGDAADYSTGDRVPFKVTATVPANVGDLKHFVLTDTMSPGLQMDDTDKRSFVVTYKKASGDSVNVSELPNTVNVSGDRSWTLDLKNYVSTLAENQVVSVEVAFTATLTTDAVTAGTGNPNTVGLEYTNKIYPTTDPDNPNTPDAGDPYEETKTITDKVTVYTFGLELDKTFEGAETGSNFTATFDLYREAMESETTNVVTIKVDGKTISVVKVGSYTTNVTDGKIVLNTTQDEEADKGFSNGSYYFVETDTAEDYNLLKEPVKVELKVYYTQTFKTTTTTTTYNKDGVVIDTSTVDIGTDTTTFYSDENQNQTLKDTTGKVSVVNKKGFELPVTGGMGTLLASFAGILLMAGGAFVFLSSRKRKNA